MKDDNKEYFLATTKSKMAEITGALAMLKGFILAKSHLDSNKSPSEEVDFYRSLYDPITILHDSIRPDRINIRNLDLVVEHTRKTMVNEIVAALSKPTNAPEETINNLNEILSKYEIIGRDTRPDGEDNLPF